MGSQNDQARTVSNRPLNVQSFQNQAAMTIIPIPKMYHFGFSRPFRSNEMPTKRRRKKPEKKMISKRPKVKPSRVNILFPCCFELRQEGGLVDHPLVLAFISSCRP